jgi:ribosomal protein S18 acetylase RimI-like enzyme
VGISLAREVDRDGVIATLVSAFAEDPVERWMFPEPERYRRYFPEFVAAFAGEAFRSGSVWTLADRAAVAVWMPPGVEPDGDAIVAMLSRGMPSARQDDVFAVLEQMDAAHPRVPHWYLPWLGVRRDRQGAGLGGRLLDHCLARVDEDRLPAFLETPNPRTVRFYERQGFAVTAVSQAGACPPMTSMLRPAGAGSAR